MIYEFQIPCIVDTKNIYKTFAKTRYIDKQTIPVLKRISRQRKALKETLKQLTTLRLEENTPYNLIDEAISYAETAAELDPIFQKDYAITKNWKWSPFLSQTKLLKYSQTIKVGKSGEILMSRYAAFAACFRTVKSDMNFIKQNIMHRDDFDLDPELSFASLMRKKPIVNKLEESLMKVLKVHIKAWMLLKKCYDCSGPSFKSLETYSEKYIESTASGMEMTLLLAKINTNMLYVEYLRYQGNYEEMGKYAKMIVTQAFLIENIIKSYNFYVDPKLYSFVQICQKLYKAISLWSLLFPYTAKLKTGTYEDGEDMNILAGGCNAFVVQIGRLHRELLNLPNTRSSPLFGFVSLYFKDVLVSKGLEVSQTYGEVFGGSAYDDFHFDRMIEIDYISRATGDGDQYQRSE